MQMRWPVDLGADDPDQALGNLSEAESSILVHLQLYEWLGSDPGMAAAYANLGFVYQELGDPEGAAAMYRQSTALFRQAGAAPQVQHVHRMLDDLAGAG